MTIRAAHQDDLYDIIAMLTTDPLGQTREQLTRPLLSSYLRAFEHIDRDPNHYLMVCEEADQLIGTFQLSFLPNMTYQGSWRAQIEGVRVHSDHQGKGIGKQMILWAINQAKARKAMLVQLTTDKQRPEAILFYENLGFVASHEGMKLKF